jgi:hypothetical protein
MLKYIGSFLIGVYVSQEYNLPNLKNKTLELYKIFQQSNVYKELNKKKEN